MITKLCCLKVFVTKAVSASETVRDEKEIAEKTYFDTLINTGNLVTMLFLCDF